MIGRNRITRLLPFFAVFLVLVPMAVQGDKAMANIQPPGIATFQRDTVISYVRIFADDQGESHFEDVDVSLSLVEVAPGISPLFASAFQEASRYGFLRAEPGWREDWHPAPQRQFLVYLAGVTEFRVSDGEVRRLGAGTILLAEDTTGKGHISEVVGEEDVVAVLIQIQAEG
jgi:hypothetical protein